MQSHVTLVIISLVLLALAAIFIKTKRHRNLVPEHYGTNDSDADISNIDDYADEGIIAVRKRERFSIQPNAAVAAVNIANNMPVTPHSSAQSTVQSTVQSAGLPIVDSLLVIYVMAKTNKQFVGYELLQTLLAQGMRFGEMNIFHRYQELGNSGTVLFSLASATEPGTFDINNMGEFAGRGLTMFMRRSGSATIDTERYNLMLKTAQQLAADLGGQVLDDKHHLLAITTE